MLLQFSQMKVDQMNQEIRGNYDFPGEEILETFYQDVEKRRNYRNNNAEIDVHKYI